MKNCLFVVFLASLAIPSFGQESDLAWVRVKAENLMASKIDTLHFVLNDGYVEKTVHSVPDENGVFLASFDVSNSIDILWGYRKNISLPLIITPNDTIHVTILSEKDGVLFGKRARTCANLMEMYEAKNRPPCTGLRIGVHA